MVDGHFEPNVMSKTDGDSSSSSSLLLLMLLLRTENAFSRTETLLRTLLVACDDDSMAGIFELDSGAQLCVRL